MKVLALDISTTTTGYCILDDKLRLRQRGEFRIKDRTLSDTLYANAIKNKVKAIIEKEEIDDLIIEDVYFGKNVENLKTWCRVHGAVGDYWFEKANQEPMYMMAVSARKLNDMHGQCTKIEVQLEMAKAYKLVDEAKYYEFCGTLGKLLKEKKEKKISKNKFDYQVKKLSKEFETVTGISEHIADSMLLGRAYYKELEDSEHV